MKPSKFNLIIPNFPNPKEYLCFNTLSRSMVILDQENIKFLKMEEISENNEITVNLNKLGFLIDNYVDEKRILKYQFDKLKYGNSVLNVTILTTYDCNFSCVYCVEEGVKKRIYLDDKTTAKLINWIKDKIKEKNPKLVNLTFYGGEPLLNTKPIKFISKEIKQYAEKSRIKFRFGIITNGSLLKSELVDELLPLGLKGIKITIDGIKEIHDKKRPFKSGKGSFDIIMRNIINSIEKVPIYLETNVDKETIDKIPLLLDYLEKINLKDKLAELEVKPIMEQIKTKSCQHFDIWPKIFNILKEIRRKGFKTRQGLRMEFCKMINSESDVFIDPLGDIYKCPAVVGKKEFKVGNIYEGFNYEYIKIMTEDIWKKCYPCPYLPICGGGCRYNAYLKTGNFFGIACEKQYWKNIFPEIIKLEYERLVKKA